MSRIARNILNSINEGIIILNNKLEIKLWNKYMEHITQIKFEDVKGKNIHTVFPNLNKHYFNDIVSDAVNNGHKMFFSAAMHKGIISVKANLNLNISSFSENNSKYLMLEFVDVTNQFVQISTLKNKVHELYKLNRELKQKEETIKKLAYYDKLTGVANRTLFYDVADKYLESARKNSSKLALMFIDVNKFKSINDSLGHEAGDKVLKKVAKTLKISVREKDLVVRHGGDEFLILIPDIEKSEDYMPVVSKINRSKYKILKYNDNEIKISFSIGISFYPQHGDSIDKLIAAADNAMYTAKRMNGEDNCFYCEY